MFSRFSPFHKLLTPSIIAVYLTGFYAVNAENSPHLVLLGDSTTIVSYLPLEERSEAVLETLLKSQYPEQNLKVSNAADNGEFIARFLLNGSYERMRKETPTASVFFLRFGINDQKRFTPEEFATQLNLLIDLLKTDYPDVEIVMETGIYVDPAHYRSNRNRILDPYWEVAREIARERGLPLCDIYDAIKRETLAGNWDMRIRRTAPGEPYVVDASQDAGKESDLTWFSDIHPNPEGVRIAAQTEARLLQDRHPTQLPAVRLRAPVAPRDQDDFIKMLGFGPERLKNRPSAPQDNLQSSTRS